MQVLSLDIFVRIRLVERLELECAVMERALRNEVILLFAAVGFGRQFIFGSDKKAPCRNCVLFLFKVGNFLYALVQNEVETDAVIFFSDRYFWIYLVKFKVIEPEKQADVSTFGAYAAFACGVFDF